MEKLANSADVQRHNTKVEKEAKAKMDKLYERGGIDEDVSKSVNKIIDLAEYAGEVIGEAHRDDVLANAIIELHKELGRLG